MTSYHGPDTSDKDPDENWLEYWDRKRHEIHGEACKCVLCAIDRGDIPAPPRMNPDVLFGDL